MALKYDFHIHTTASPCADMTMTPHNIVNMSILKGLDIIAITDHQTVANCEAVMKVGKQKGLLVVPGMEIECMEEFHLIALFPRLEIAKEIGKWIGQGLPPIKNRKDLFGEQLILDEQDEVIGEIEQLLLTATQITVEDIVKEVRKKGGIIYPAHIDRNSYSILSNLGTLPPELNFDILEISQKASPEEYVKKYEKSTIIQSSDAHYLFDIAENMRKIPESNNALNDLVQEINKNI